MRRTLIALVMLAGAVGVSTASAQPLAVLVAGQSNAMNLAHPGDVFGAVGSEPGPLTVALDALGIANASVAIGGTYIDCWLFVGRCPWTGTAQGRRVTHVVWWQGELEGFAPRTGDVEQYALHLRLVIAAYRHRFGAHVTFVVVLLQNYWPTGPGSEPPAWTGVRDAQMAVCLSERRVACIATTDITDGDIHPVAAYPEIVRRIAAVVSGQTEGLLIPGVHTQ